MKGKIAWLVWPYHDSDSYEFTTVEPDNWNHKTIKIVYFEVEE